MLFPSGLLALRVGERGLTKEAQVSKPSVRSEFPKANALEIHMESQVWP